MKVSDIIITEELDSYKRIPIVTVRKPPKVATNARNNPNVKELGSGMQGSAYGFKTRPNSVTKTAHLHSLNDPYLQYITAVMQHQDNPFFPRIHNAKILEYTPSRWDKQMLDPKLDDYKKKILRKPQYTLIVQMEKLRPMHGLTHEVAAQALQRLGIDQSEMNPKSWGRKRDGVKTTDYDSKMRANFDEDEFREKLMNKTKNPQFKEALQITEPLWQRYGADMKDDNLMLRLTPHGPQVVLADPIYPEL